MNQSARNESTLEVRSQSAIERHAQTIIAAILLMLVGWMATTLNSLVQGQARQEERVISIQAQLSNNKDHIERLDTQSRANATDIKVLRYEVDSMRLRGGDE